MKYKYTCEFNKEYFWYVLLGVYRNYFASDNQISEFLGISVTEYQNILITKFNGIIKKYSSFNEGIFFNIEEDCKKAIDYLNEITEGCLIVKTLIN